MAGPTKRTKKPSEHDPEDAQSDESEEEQESGGFLGEIQATFEGRNPEGIDFHGIKQLLQQLFLKAHIDLSQLSDMLIAQVGVGSVLKQSLMDSDDEEDMDMVEESDVFGITSVINLTGNRETPCVQQFYALVDELSKQHASPEVQNELQKILKSNNKIGFLINERFVNIPAKIFVPILTSLYEELQRIKKKNPAYDFQYFFLISKICKPKSGGDVIYSNDEEVLFSKEAELTFEFSVEKETDTGLGGRWASDDKEVIPYRKITLFKAEKLNIIMQKLPNFVQ